MTKSIILKQWESYSSGEAITIECRKVEEARSKQLSPLTLTTSVQEWSTFVADNKSADKNLFVDLLRVQRRFIVTGKIHKDDVASFREILARGGSLYMNYANNDYWVNMEKYALTELPEDATGTDAEHGGEAVPEYWDVTFTVIEGISYGQGKPSAE